MKTSELTGPALDWAVSKCVGNWDWEQGDLDAGEYGPGFKPSTDWAHGGPIIEREELELYKWGIDGWKAHATNYQFLNTPQEQPLFCEQYGPTPLIAAMRCYVASKLGDTVDIPEELTP